MSKNILRIISLILPFVMLSGLTSAQEFVSEGYDEIRYETELAKIAQSAQPYLALSFGTGDVEVGGAAQDSERRTEGVPNAFMAKEDGSVLILDAINFVIKHFAPNGDLIKKIDFRKAVTTASGEALTVRDFALAPGDGYYLFSNEDGTVRKINSKGEVQIEIEGLHDAWALGSDPSGNLLIQHPVLKGLMRFNPSGEIIEHYQRRNIFPFTDIQGAPYGIEISDNVAEVMLFRATQASPSEDLILATFTLDIAQKDDVKFVSSKILGTDAAWNVYLELIACDSTGVVHVHRLLRVSPSGETLAKSEIKVIPYFSPDLPRHHVVLPDGRVMGFHCRDDKFNLCVYTIQ